MYHDAVNPRHWTAADYLPPAFEVSVHDEVLAACSGLSGADVTIFMVGTDVWSAASGERFKLFVVDVSGSAVTIAVSADWSQIPSVQELQSLYEYGGRIVDSVRF